MVPERKQMTTTSKQEELGLDCMQAYVSRLEADLAKAVLRSSHIKSAFSPRANQYSPKDSGEITSDSFRASDLSLAWMEKSPVPNLVCVESTNPGEHFRTGDLSSHVFAVTQKEDLFPVGMSPLLPQFLVFHL